MMFFQDTRSIGVVFWIAAILYLVEAILVLQGSQVETLTGYPETITDKSGFCYVIGFGSLISAAIYLLNAHRVMSQKRTRLDVLRRYVLTIGLCTLVDGITAGLSVYLYTNDPDAGIYVTIITIVLSIFLVLISKSIVNGKKGTGKKIVWAILVIAFAMMLINSLLPANNYWQYAENIANVLIAFFMLTMILDSGVRTEMGVKA